jgi:hypothetical protein
MVLLGLAVVLFASAWSGDRPRANGTVAAHGPVRRPKQASAAKRTIRVHTAATHSSNLDLPQFWRDALPHGVTTGEYQLVATNGRTQRVIITAELLQSLGHDPDVHSEPLYALEHSGHTAYLIRIDSKLHIAAEPRTVR